MGWTLEMINCLDGHQQFLDSCCFFQKNRTYFEPLHFIWIPFRIWSFVGLLSTSIESLWVQSQCFNQSDIWINQWFRFRASRGGGDRAYVFTDMRRLKATEMLEWPLMVLGSELPYLINERLVSPMMSIEKLMCYIFLFSTKLSGSPNKVDGIAKQRETSVDTGCCRCHIALHVYMLFNHRDFLFVCFNLHFEWKVN